MKSLLLIGFFIATVLGDYEVPSKEQWLAARQQCFDEIPVPEKDQEPILKFEFHDEDIFHKYIRCLSLKMGHWDDSTGFDGERIKVIMRKYLQDAALKNIDACLDNNETKKNSPEKWAYDNFMCMENNVFKHARKIVEKK